MVNAFPISPVNQGNIASTFGQAALLKQSRPSHHGNFAIPMPNAATRPAMSAGLDSAQSMQSLIPTMDVDASGATKNNLNQINLRHPRQAPSAVITENLAEARALLSEGVAQNLAAVKRAYTSSIMNDMPRFKSTFDLIA